MLNFSLMREGTTHNCAVPLLSYMSYVLSKFVFFEGGRPVLPHATNHRDFSLSICRYCFGLTSFNLEFSLHVSHNPFHVCLQGAALLYNNFMKDFLADTSAARIPSEGKVEVRAARSCAIRNGTVGVHKRELCRAIVLGLKLRFPSKHVLRLFRF